MTTTEQHTELTKAREELASAQERLRKLEEQAAKSVKWEPKGGEFNLRRYGDVAEFPADEQSRLAGSEYPTREAAESALPYVEFFKRLACLAQELNPSGRVGGKYRVYFDTEGWASNATLPNVGHVDYRDPWDLFETRESAQAAADILNRDGWVTPGI